MGILMKKRFAIVGASQRAMGMYAIPITRQFQTTSELVALCDLCQTRMDYINEKIPKAVPTYKDFDAMLAGVPIDTVIVTTKDSVHHEFIIKALHAGKDVISEKPMTIDNEKCRAILEAERETDRTVTVTFNYRFTPPATAIRRILAEGTIGRAVTVDMHWILDTNHGADYFRRWHRRKANSGGLQVHKSTHHFDLINWWLQDEPASVIAQGGLDFYGRNGPFRSKRCKGCPHRRKCPFHWDISTDAFHSEFYLTAEEESGYVRDGCVFDEEIDIEDNYNLLVEYKGGTRLSYSLQAWSPWEGFRLDIQGTKGRLEYTEQHDTHNWQGIGDKEIVVMLNDGSRIVHTPSRGEGGHGGGDPLLLSMLFEGAHDDPLGHMAGATQGAHSILVGVAATKSIQSHGQWIKISDLL